MKHNKNRASKRRQSGRSKRNRAGRARPPSNSLRIKLRWSDDQTTTTLSSWRFGLAQFWNQLPGYYAEYMKIYKMSRIISLQVKCTVINTTSNTPAEVVLAVMPYSDYSKTLAQVKLLPRAAIRYLSGSGGIDKVTIQKKAALNQALSNNSRAVRDYQQSASEAASTLALLPDTPILALYVGGASAEPTLRVFIQVDYNIEFFEPEYPGSTAITKSSVKPNDMTAGDKIVGPTKGNTLVTPNPLARPKSSNKKDKPERLTAHSDDLYPDEYDESSLQEEYFDGEEQIPKTPKLVRVKRGIY